LKSFRWIVIAFLAWAIIGSRAEARQIKFAAAKAFTSGVINPGCVATGDFNGDGHLDLVVTDHDNSFAVFLGNGDGTFKPPTLYTLDFYEQRCAAVADFNGDGKQDLMVVGGDSSGNSLALLEGNGDGTFQAPIYIYTALGASAQALAVGDLNNDHNLDVFIGGNGSCDEVLGDGKGGFQEGAVQNVYGGMVALGDFNGDGNLDVVATGLYTDSIGILLGNGDGMFQTPQIYNGLSEPFGVVVGDFNGDKKLDFAVTVYPSAGVLIFLGNGDGTFTNSGQWNGGNSPGIVAAGDFNKDGKLDLAVTDLNGNVITVLTGKGDGTFPTSAGFQTASEPDYVAAADINHDGSLDLVVTNYSANSVSILLNAAGTQVRLTSSANPSTAGQAVTFTATVIGTVTTSSTPTGTVVFKNGPVVLGSASLSQGKTSFVTSTLAKGTHKITASYSGDTTFNPNLSTVLVQTVN
jgi:Bacterial Ig-like domain (group 3)/FG-GAP-like repeat